MNEHLQGATSVTREGVTVSLLPTVQQAISNVKRAIGAVAKDKKVSDGPAKYAYRGIDAILDAAHDALVEQGLIIAPVQAVPRYESRRTANDKPQQWVTICIDWLVMGPSGDVLLCETPETNALTGEVVIVKRPPQTIGEAADTSDKATNKAHTAAWKILLSQLFAIPYSADEQDEHRLEVGVDPWDGQDSETHDAAAWAARRLEALPADLAKRVCERLTKRAHDSGIERRVTKIDDLPPSWLPVWEKTLEAAEKSLAERAAAESAQSASDVEQQQSSAEPENDAQSDAEPVSEQTASESSEQTAIVELPTTWEQIAAMSPSTLSRVLSMAGHSPNGSPRVLRERLASKLGIAQPEPEQ